MAQIIKADLTEMVFRTRNRAYGSYELRKRIPRRTIIAFLIASSVFTVALFGPQIAKLFEGEEDIPVVDARKFTYAELSEPPPIDAEKPPPPPPDVTPPPPPARAQVKFVPPEIVKDEKARPEETIEKVDTFKVVDTGVKNVEGAIGLDLPAGIEDGTGTAPVEFTPTEEAPDVNAFVAVEKEPAPVNMDQIQKRIGYPPAALEAGIKGTVTVRILVSKTGDYEKHVILRSAHPILTQAVEKELKSLKFTPGIQGGKPIRVWVNIPFNFKPIN